ncbi:MAG: hypothetical protein EXX96DRAFT_577506 [Benjaminiella poitrasii]|nr:MAG: hypothetical protein EXX96DRAFT_577506 [Benjaminiella poitrasii]
MSPQTNNIQANAKNSTTVDSGCSNRVSNSMSNISISKKSNLTCTRSIKSLCSAIQLAPLAVIAPIKNNRNRITPSPFQIEQGTQGEQAINGESTKNNSHSSLSSSIGYLFKRLSLSSNSGIRSFSKSSTNNAEQRHPLRISARKESIIVHIYLKSPYFVAGGELAGSIEIQVQSNNISNEDLLAVYKDIMGIKLYFIGVEAIVSSSHHVYEKTFQFLKIKTLDFTGIELIVPHQKYSSNKIINVPFVITLPSEMIGTYNDKKASIEYFLQSELYKKTTTKSLITKQTVVVYSNMALKPSNDTLALYRPVIQHNRHIQTRKPNEGLVTVDLSMPRTIWMSGGPIYISLKIQNNTQKKTIRDIKLELLRKQDLFCLTAKDSKTTKLVSSSSKVISVTSLAKLNWWKPLEPNSANNFILTIEAPTNQVTIGNQQTLINVSFFIQLSVCSSKNSNEVIAKLPVVLIHPISMDPPPGNYIKTIGFNTESQNDLVHNGHPPNFQKQRQQDAKRNNVKLLEHKTNDGDEGKLLHVKQENLDANDNKAFLNNPPAGPAFLTSNREKNIKSTSNDTITTMKKSLSNWRSRLSRKNITASALNTNNLQQQQQKLQIPSPELSASFSTSSSLCSSIGSIPPLVDDSHLRLQKSNKGGHGVLKFGQVEGPKRYGQQPGALCDASVDIQNHFSVSRVADVIQSYAAEKVELINGAVIKKEGHGQYPSIKFLLPNYQAPPEKCEIPMSFLSSQRQKVHKNAKRIKPSSTGLVSQTNKRRIASSRHLRNIKRKCVQTSKNGRHLLALPAASN